MARPSCLVWIVVHVLCSALILDLAIGDSSFKLHLVEETPSGFYARLLVDSSLENFKIELDQSETSIGKHAPVSGIPANVQLRQQTLEVDFGRTSSSVLGVSPIAFTTRLGGNSSKQAQSSPAERFFPQLKQSQSTPSIIGLELPIDERLSGELFLGGYNKDRIEVDTLVYASVKSSDAWDIQVERISVGHQPLNVKDIRLSTSFSSIVFPNASEPIITKIFPRINRWNDSPSNDAEWPWYTPCASISSLPDLHLQLQEQTFTLESKYFVTERSIEGQCRVDFGFHEHDRVDLGVNWMRRFYTVLDAERHKVGIAKLKLSVGSVKNSFEVHLLGRGEVIDHFSGGNQDHFGLVPGQSVDFGHVLKALYRQYDIPRVVGVSENAYSFTVFVGGIDSARIQGELVYTDLHNGYIVIESFGFGDTICGTDLAMKLKSDLVLPETSRANVESVFPPMKNESNSKGWRTPCPGGGLPDLCLSIGRKPFCLPSRTFSDDVDSNALCYVNFQFHGESSLHIPQRIWGELFYMEADYFNARIGLAPLSHTAPVVSDTTLDDQSPPAGGGASSCLQLNLALSAVMMILLLS